MRVYTLDDLNTTEGQDALINLCDKYYPTLASSWAAYGKSLADVADAAALREAKLAYIPNTLQRGSMVYYEVIPESIVITAPFLMNMTPTMSNASRFTQQQEGTPKYAYTLCLSESFPWTSWWPIRLPTSARKRQSRRDRILTTPPACTPPWMATAPPMARPPAWNWL